MNLERKVRWRSSAVLCYMVSKTLPDDHLQDSMAFSNLVEANLFLKSFQLSQWKEKEAGSCNIEIVGVSSMLITTLLSSWSLETSTHKNYLPGTDNLCLHILWHQVPCCPIKGTQPPPSEAEESGIWGKSALLYGNYLMQAGKHWEWEREIGNSGLKSAF